VPTTFSHSQAIKVSLSILDSIMLASEWVIPLDAQPKAARAIDRTTVPDRA